MTPTSPNIITLEIKGLGHVPSFKNMKRICGNRLITNPKAKKTMDRIKASFALQLRSAFQTTGFATSTVDLQQFLTACVPRDDCWQVIPEITVRAVKVPKGQEGAVITIERISPRRSQDFLGNAGGNGPGTPRQPEGGENNL